MKLGWQNSCSDLVGIKSFIGRGKKQSVVPRARQTWTPSIRHLYNHGAPYRCARKRIPEFCSSFPSLRDSSDCFKCKENAICAARIKNYTSVFKEVTDLHIPNTVIRLIKGKNVTVIHSNLFLNCERVDWIFDNRCFEVSRLLSCLLNKTFIQIRKQNSTPFMQNVRPTF